MFNRKKWVLKDKTVQNDIRAEEIRNVTGLESATARILVSRGYDTPDKVKKFFGKENTLMYNPYLLKDMDRAVDRILEAVYKKEKISVYGDYDVDGVTAVSVLYLYLNSLGADTDYYIPNRAAEGYGMNTSALDGLKEKGTRLIVTVDTGITAVEEADYIKSLGMGLVITDHHSCHGDIPVADAVVNPKRPDDGYPFKELAGVGVVFKLVTALEFAIRERALFGGDGGLSLSERFSRMTENDGADFLEKVCADYLDLVTLGTVSDVMTLTDENRLICSYGLYLIENSPRLGLLCLMDRADGMKNRRFPKKRKVSASYIGFTVAPRINAAGRISDASLGVELFTSSDKTRADEIASRLCELNTLRQTEENRIMCEATELAQRTHDFEHDPVLVLASENWNHGVIGIVSSRLTEKYSMPSILIALEDGVGKGSGRSVKGVNISSALSACGDILVRYGGHELAAGLTVKEENIPELKKRINDYVRNVAGSGGSEVCLEIDCEASEEEINLKLARETAYFEPCGAGNPQPVFLMKNAGVLGMETIGDGKHTKLTVGSEKNHKTALIFGVPADETDISVGDFIDIVFRLDINEFRGTVNEQLLVCDVRLAGEFGYYEEECRILRGTENGEKLPGTENLLPDRNDFAAVYREINGFGTDGKKLSLYRLHRIFAKNGMRAAKIKLVLEILSDVGLIGFEILPSAGYSGCEIYRLCPVKYSGKVNLFGTPRYKNVKNVLSERE